ncbi:MAG: Rieske (2Fe-2S) protein [bacterium]|nr:Rieske (2Fe-2S) protein [bacterium]
MATDERDPADSSEDGPDRRKFLATASTTAMAAGLTGGYGAFGLIAGRFLYPARPDERQWQFVAETGRFETGDSLLYRGPSGETINVVRQGNAGGAEDFIALSSTCPHLGCQVAWEAQNDRYFCPCHNGTFDARGLGTGGPPGDAGMELPRYPLKVDGGLLFIEVPVDQLADKTGEILDTRSVRPPAGEPLGIHGPGHDPCLACDGQSRFDRKA